MANMLSKQTIPHLLNNDYMKTKLTQVIVMVFKNNKTIRNNMPHIVLKQHLIPRISYSYDVVDHQLISFVSRYGLTILRLSLATVFLWFGILKILNVSPVTPLA